MGELLALEAGEAGVVGVFGAFPASEPGRGISARLRGAAAVAVADGVGVALAVL